MYTFVMWLYVVCSYKRLRHRFSLAEFAEDNRKLKEALQLCETQKEADKKAIIIMKETLEQFTEQKLKLTNDVSELQKKNKADEESLAKLRIENESLQRQLNRLNEDNEALLKDIDRMEDQLKQVRDLSINNASKKV